MTAPEPTADPTRPRQDIREGMRQAWWDHLRDERDYWCGEHGFVAPTERQHGGRSRAFVCPVDGCGRTCLSLAVDWGAYRQAHEADDPPPCPRCGETDITTVPASPQYRCSACGHGYGSAGGYR